MIDNASISVFKNALLKFYLSKASSLFDIIDQICTKFLTRLRVTLSHLQEHKFQHNFSGTINPLCSCSLEAESTYQSLLRCLFVKTLLDNIVEIIGWTSNLSARLFFFIIYIYINLMVFFLFIFTPTTRYIIYIYLLFIYRDLLQCVSVFAAAYTVKL